MNQPTLQVESCKLQVEEHRIATNLTRNLQLSTCNLQHLIC
jgi:hypothetical protein